MLTDATYVPSGTAVHFWDRAGDRLQAGPFGPTAAEETRDLFTPDRRRVPGITVPVEDAAEWLAARGSDPRACDGSLGFWAVASRVGLELVARGQVVPVARPGTDQGGLNIAWEPVFASAADRRRRIALSRAMPGAARAASPDMDAADVLDAFWRALVDALLRRAHTALPPTYGWELDFVEHLASPPGVEWQVGSRPVRDCVLAWLGRPPAAETWEGIATLLPPGPDGADWHITYHVRSGEDPDTVVAEASVRANGPEAQRAALAGARRLVEDLLEARGPIDVVDARGAAVLAMFTTAETRQGDEGSVVARIVLPHSLRVWGPGGVQARLHGERVDKAESRLQAPLLAELAGATLAWELAVDERVLTDGEVADLVSGRRPLVNVDDTWVLVTDEMRRELSAQLDAGPPQLGPAEVILAALGGRLPREDAAAVPVAVAGQVAEIVELLRGGPLHGVPPPSTFSGELRPYQERGLEWLLRLEERGLGGCLADDMGLGKTVQAIALLLVNPLPTLVVCPTSVLGNWERELHRFAPSLRTVRHHGPERPRTAGVLGDGVDERHVVLTTYAILRRDVEVLSEMGWGRVILDEAQHTKNPASETARAARRVAGQAHSRLALTGTPVENTLGELWSILDFTNPGVLGSHASFRKRFVLPIENGDLDLARALQRVSGPFVLRRSKSDPSVRSDLPPKHETVLYCDLTEEQRALYAAAVEDGMAGVAAARGIGRRGLVLALLTRLKQICNHAALGLERGSPGSGRLRRDGVEASSGKLELLLDMIEDVTSSGDRCLVFTQFVEMGKILASVLEAPFFHGGLTGRARDNLVDEFQADGGPPVLVVSLRAGGQGLNLTAANRVFHFDRWWNPAVEDQASDRAHRIGQTRDVWVHKLVCLGTVEERIDAMLERKRALADTVVAEGESWVTELGDDELARLVALEDAP
ncbi:MAG: DEAD/DEAH box helicase [Acidimicrobiia bacterium]|nr:DEAD/DEAH box helicase [Acidimicrobiia bacterium]